MKQNKKKFIFFVLIIIWMILVFLFSSQNSFESAGLSGGITHKIVSVLFPYGSNKNLIDNVEHIVRKLAHFSMYFVGGILIFNFLNLYEINLKKKILYSQAFGTFYAITDEFHQIFVPGRSGELRDVIIDSSGVLLGIILSCFLILKVNKRYILK